MEVTAGHIDFRHYVPAIRAKAKGKVVESTTKPEVRMEIEYILYKRIIPYIPVDTGALRMSPDADFGSHPMTSSKHPGVIRYAHGGITPNEMIFDPYDKYGNHYAGNVRGFNPGYLIRRNTKMVSNTIASVIVRGTE